MNDDTFSRNEAYMVQFHRSNGSYMPREPASGFANVVGARLANDAMREDAERVAEQELRIPNAQQFGHLAGMSAHEAADAMASSLTRKNHSDRIVDFWTMSDSIDIGNAIRESGLSEITVIADLVRLNNQRERDIAALRSELADLRAALPADPTGAHPYRSTATKAPSSPVAASDRAERVDGRPEGETSVNGQRDRLLMSAGTFAVAIGMACACWNFGDMRAALAIVALGMVPMGLSALERSLDRGVA